MRSLLAAAFVSVVLLACPRSSGSTVMGSDDEQMDRDSAQLEELRSRGDVMVLDQSNEFFRAMRDSSAGGPRR